MSTIAERIRATHPVARPILFSAPMVRAILASTKTQTRRVLKWREVDHCLNVDFTGLQVQRFDSVNGPVWVLISQRGDGAWEHRTGLNRCPYGKPGDLLWVRETFAKIDGQTRPWIETDYRATYQHGDRLGDTLGLKKRWTPAIHMPRDASRITLEITGVRVERLQKISEADAIAEGIEPLDAPHGARRWRHYGTKELHDEGYSAAWEFAANSYASLWDSINGSGSWDANPWVWVVEFRRV